VKVESATSERLRSIFRRQSTAVPEKKRQPLPVPDEPSQTPPKVSEKEGLKSVLEEAPPTPEKSGAEGVSLGLGLGLKRVVSPPPPPPRVNSPVPTLGAEEEGLKPDAARVEKDLPTPVPELNGALVQNGETQGEEGDGDLAAEGAAEGASVDADVKAIATNGVTDASVESPSASASTSDVVPPNGATEEHAAAETAANDESS
jgi:hypothetical protein